MPKDQVGFQIEVLQGVKLDAVSMGDGGNMVSKFSS